MRVSFTDKHGNVVLDGFYGFRLDYRRLQYVKRRPGRSCHMNDIDECLGRQRVGRSHRLKKHILLLFMHMLSVLNKFSSLQMFWTPVTGQALKEKVSRSFGSPPPPALSI